MNAPATPASVTTETGVTVTAAMSPQERFNAIAASMGAPTVDPKADNNAALPVQFRRNADGSQMQAPAGVQLPAIASKAQAPQSSTSTTAPAVAGKAAPSGMQSAEAAAKVAAFDAEMRAKGLQITPRDGQQPAPDVDYVQPAIAKLEKAYIAQVTKLRETKGLTPEARERAIATLRQQYETEAGEFMRGRLMSQSRSEFLAREREPAPAPGNQVPDGYVPMTAENTYGYNVGNITHASPDLVHGLKAARAAGISQETIAAILARI